MIQLKGNSFCLRQWALDDETSLIKHANNPKIARYLADRFPYPYTVAAAQEWLNHHTQKQSDDNFAIDINGEVAGGIGIEFKADIFRKTALLGYWLGEPFWGRGIMPEAVKLMTDYAFEKFDIIRIEAGVFEDNPASMRVLEKAGFTKEGISKNALFKYGQVYSEHKFALLKG